MLQLAKDYEGYWVSRCMLWQDPVFEEVVMAEKGPGVGRLYRRQ